MADGRILAPPARGSPGQGWEVSQPLLGMIHFPFFQGRRPRFKMQLHHCPESGSGCGERPACLQPQVPLTLERPWPGLSTGEERCPWFQSTCSPTIVVLLEVESHFAKVKTSISKKHPPPAKKRLKSHTHTHTHTHTHHPRLKKGEQEAALAHLRVHAVRSWAATPSAETDHLAFCQGEATGRPQPIRPRAQGPSTQP